VFATLILDNDKVNAHYTPLPHPQASCHASLLYIDLCPSLANNGTCVW